jgi:hypothetical protein
MESLLELRDLVLQAMFLPVAAAIVLVATVGSGLWNTRRKRTVFALSLVVFAVALAVGIHKHEWGEVLFNGQLL